MTTGKFITLEGVEGVGKSTNLELISGFVKSGGYDVLVTREPGGTTLGERVREILLDKDEHGMTPMAELLLMFAARAQHVEEVIKPALARGTWVVSDRFTDSSYAYQGGGRQLGNDAVAALEHQVLGGFGPDLVIILEDTFNSKQIYHTVRWADELNLIWLSGDDSWTVNEALGSFL